MKILPHQLQENGYQAYQSFDINDMMPFLQKHLYSTHWLSVLYWAFTIFILLGLSAKMLFSPIPFKDSLGQVGIGFFFFVPLLVPHELLHAFVFWLFGAKNIVIKAQWKKFIFYAAAHNFVLNRSEFMWVAVVPFLVISSCLFFLYVFFPSFQFYVLGALFLHTAGCSGDFALMSFFLKNENMLTYDDLEQKISYFYTKEKP